MKLINVARDIVSGKLIPDLFDRLPVTKAGKFPANRVIPIYTSGLTNLDIGESYVACEEIMLCLMTKTKGMFDGYTDTRAALKIRYVPVKRNMKILLNQDFSINDITTTTQSLPLKDILPGGIYEDKTGAKYLYLGKIMVLSDACLTRHLTHSDSEFILPYAYIHITKAVQKLIDNAATIDDFLEAYIISKKLNPLSSIPISERDTPRYFQKEIACPFTQTNFAITNKGTLAHSQIKYAFVTDTAKYCIITD